MSNESAWVSKLLNKLTVRGTLGHFKFINFFILTNLVLIFLYYKKKLKNFKLIK